LQHRVHRSLRPLWIPVLECVAERTWNDLPPEPVPVLDPAALTFGAARAELRPELVDLLLSVAADGERDRLVELELRPTVERDEVLTGQREAHGERFAWLRRRPARIA